MMRSERDDLLDAGIRTFLMERADAADASLEAVDLVAGRIARRISVGRSGSTGRTRTILLAAAMLLVAALAVAVAGALRRPPGLVPTDLVILRDGQIAHTVGESRDLAAFRVGDLSSGRRGYVAAAWSPDGRHLAAVRDDGEELLEPIVEIIRLDGETVGRIQLAAGGVPGIAWAPDSRSIAVAALPTTAPKSETGDRPSTLSLGLFALDGTPLRQFDLPAAATETYARVADGPDTGGGRQLAWGPSGWIAFQSIGTDSPPTRLWLLNAASGELRSVELADLGSVHSVAWDREDGRLAIGHSRCDGCGSALSVIEVATMEVTLLIEAPGDPAPAERYDWLAWAPEGRRIAAVTFDGEPIPEGINGVFITNRIRVLDLTPARIGEPIVAGTAVITDTWETAEIRGEFTVAPPLAWSTDGARIIYLASGPGAPTVLDLKSVAASGGPSELVVPDVDGFAVVAP